MNKANSITLSVLLCLGCCLALPTCQEESVTHDQVLTVMDSLEHKFEWLDYRISQETWEWYTTGQSDSLEFYRGLFEHVVTDPQALRILKRGRALLGNDDDLRRLELLQAALLTSRVEANSAIAGLRDSLSRIDITYRAEFEGEAATENELYRIYRSDDNRARREQAYRAYCSVGDLLADGLAQLIRYRNQEARKLGYNNFFNLTFAQQNLSQEDYLRLLHRLDSASLQPYQTILGEIEDRAGRQQIEIWDLAHSFSDVRKQVDRYFPADSQMEYADRSLQALGFDLDKLPIYFDLEPRQDKSQLAYAFPIKVPYDIRVLGNLSDGLYSNTVLMHEIGHALHFAYVDQDRALYAYSYDPAWAEGMAQTVAAMTEDSNWLTSYAKVPAQIADAYDHSRRQQDITALRTTLTRLMFEYEVYRNPNRDLNALYWDLSERYLMLPRHDDLKPWAAIIHYTTHPVYLHNYLLADIITAQTVDRLRDTYETIIGSRSVGSFLVQNYFRFGSRYDWRDMLERGTGEELNPEYLIQALGLL